MLKCKAFRASAGVKNAILGGLCPDHEGELTASKPSAAFFDYLAKVGRLSGQLPSPKFNSCISPCLTMHVFLGTL